MKLTLLRFASVLPALVLVTCGSPAPPPAPARPAPGPHAAVIDALVGAWAGDADTPFGPMKLGLTFAREPDGAVHARVDGGPDMYLDFRFHHDGARWLLTEEGALPGVGVQRHTLVPDGAEAGAARWRSDEPGYLVVTVAVDGDAMTFHTRVRGEDHATFRLSRVRAPAAVSSTR